MLKSKLYSSSYKEWNTFSLKQISAYNSSLELKRKLRNSKLYEKMTGCLHYRRQISTKKLEEKNISMSFFVKIDFLYCQKNRRHFRNFVHLLNFKMDFERVY